jgi:hypothetical protein
VKKVLVALATVGAVAAVGVSSANAYDGFPVYKKPAPTNWGSSYRSSSYRPYVPSFSYYGQLNRAGFLKNQYVSPYYRSSGTYVPGYWRNSPVDSYPTCSLIRC